MASWFTGLLAAAPRIVLLLVLALPAAAADVTVGRDTSYPLSRHLSFLIDPGRELTFQDVMRPEVQAKFQALHSGRITSWKVSSRPGSIRKLRWRDSG